MPQAGVGDRVAVHFDRDNLDDYAEGRVLTVRDDGLMRVELDDGRYVTVPASRIGAVLEHASVWWRLVNEGPS